MLCCVLWPVAGVGGDWGQGVSQSLYTASRYSASLSSPLPSLFQYQDQEDNRHKHKHKHKHKDIQPQVTKSGTHCVVDCSLYSSLPLLSLSLIKRQTDTDNDNRKDKQTQSLYQRCIKLLHSLPLPATTPASLSSFPARQR